MICSLCQHRVTRRNALLIDGAPICRRCLHQGAAAIPTYPIGYVREGLAPDAPHGSQVEGLARLELLPTMDRFMEGLAEEPQLTVVWAFDRSPGVTSVFNRRDGKPAGIFSSRSPHRLNPIAITEVDLVRVEGTNLYVRGLDAYEGSPILDLKTAPPRP
jgi:tRNA (Thr-GGU) A37 N-methylase